MAHTGRRSDREGASRRLRDFAHSSRPRVAFADGGGAGLDLLFDLFSDQHRRFVLYYLEQTHRPVDLPELATQVVAMEADVDPDAVTETERARTASKLHHVHLPRLADAGFVEYDPDANVAVSSTRTDRFAELLAVSKQLEGEKS